jgi:hypothetical protein
MERKKETAIELATIRGERIDLLVGIEASAETVAGSPGGIAAHDQDVAVPAGPLALNAPEPSVEVEDEVVAAALRDRLVDVDAGFVACQAMPISAIAPF